MFVFEDMIKISYKLNINIAISNYSLMGEQSGLFNIDNYRQLNIEIQNNGRHLL